MDNFLYANDISPPCRAVLMVAKESKMDYKLREVKQEDQKYIAEPFLKIIPARKILSMVDYGFTLWDSHAIISYLADEFANRLALYPKELQKRAEVIQCFIFNASVLSPALKRAVRPVLTGERTSILKEDIDACKDAFSQLDKLLEDTKWLVQYETYTVADICCVATISSASVLVDVNQYPNIKAWMKCCEEEIPSYKEFNEPGLKKFHALLAPALSNS
ncbi:glutathione S-transferase 1-like isoform X2 [Bombus fervidus]